MAAPIVAPRLAGLFLVFLTLVAAAPLRRQQSRLLLQVNEANVPFEESSVFDSTKSRILHDDFSMSLPLTRSPVTLRTPEPTPSVVASDTPSSSPTGLVVSDAPSSSPTGLVVSDAPSSSPTLVVVSDVPSSSPTEDAFSDAPSSTPTGLVVSDAPSSFPTEDAISDAPSSSPTEDAASDTPSSSPTEDAASDTPSSFPTDEITSVAAASLRRQASRLLLHVTEVDVPFDSTEGRILHDSFSMSLPLTRSPVTLRTPEPTPSIVASDTPSSSPTGLVVSDAPSSTPTGLVVSDAPSSSPTEGAASDAPSSSPTLIAVSDFPSSSPTEDAASDAPSSSPTEDISSVAAASLRRQQPRLLLQVSEANVPFDDSSVFESSKSRILHDGFSMSLPLTKSPVTLRTPEPTPSVVASDVPSSSPTGLAASDTPSSFPTEAAFSDAPSSTPTEDAVSDVPSSSPTEDTTNEVPNSSPTEDAASDVSTSSPTTDVLQWVQIGKLLVPLLEGLAGTDVAMSADGSIMAVGIPGDSPGYIGVYSLNETTQTWDMLGQEIFDVVEEGSVRFGSAVALSSDGRTVAGGSGYSRSVPDANGLSGPLAGRAQVNVFENGVWEQKGQSLVGTQCRSLGWSTALSGDGNRWVVSTPDVSGSDDFRCNDIDFGAGRGMVQVFDFIDNEWVQVGSVILGTLPGSELGQAVAISRNGKRIAAYSQGLSDVAPYYQVFELDEFGSWVQMGEDIVVEIAVAETSTNTVALSADGSRIVVTNKRRVSGVGYFKVLEWTPDTNQWTQIGADVEDVDGCCLFFTYDTSVAMSDGGERVIYGNTGYRQGVDLGDEINSFQGNVRVFEWIDGAWQQVGGSILGDDLFGEVWFGYSTAMSSNGRRIAASAPIAFPNYVAAYELPWV